MVEPLCAGSLKHPSGVFHLVIGRDSEVGDRLIAFTGSMEVGLHIWETAGRTPPGRPSREKVICEMAERPQREQRRRPQRSRARRTFKPRHQGRGGHEAMAEVVHHHAEARQRPDAEQRQVAGLSENDFVIRFASLRAEDGIPDFALDLRLRGRGENPLAAWGDAGALQDLRREPSQFRAGSPQRFQRLGCQFFAFGIAGGDVD